jgi:exodeoxyribonuclease VIII
MTIFDEMNTTIERFFGPLPNWTTNGGKQMTEKQYNELNAVRRSDLLKLRKSPLHFKWTKEHPEEPSAALIFGSAMHKAVLEPDTFAQEFAVAPKIDRRTNAGKEAWEIFQFENDDKTIISQADADQILEMKMALHDHPTAERLLSGEHEQTYVWTDTETGEECKVRLDCLTEWRGHPVIVDYKTVSSCEDYAFERECRKFGYKIQAGMYTEGLLVATNFITDAGFMFVCQEKTPPYAVRVYECDPSFIAQGNRQFHELLRYYHQCKETNEWPGYSDGYLTADSFEEVAEE